MIRSLVAVICILMIALPAAAPAAVLSETGKQAMVKVQAGDMAAAIALLEPLRREGQATDVDLALLGALYQESGNARLAFEVLRPLADAGNADAAALYNAGRAARGVGEAAAAEGYFARSVELMSDSPAARELGLIRGSQGRLAEAYSLLHPWAVANPDDLMAVTAAAVCALQIERVREAESLIAMLPDSPKAFLLRGQLLMQKGDPVGALEILVPMLDEHPQEMSADLHVVCADAYIQTGRSKEAIPLLRKLSSPGPRVLRMLADALYRSGELDQALATLALLAESALEGEGSRSPAIQQIVLDYGRMLVAAGRQAEALPYLERAAEIDPEQKLAWKGLGEALIAVGRTDEARVALQRFQELTTTQTERRRKAEAAAKDPVARNLFEAQKAIGQGRGEEVLPILRQEIKISPTDLRPRLLEVRALLSIGRVDEALVVANSNLAAFPDHPDAIYTRGAVRLGLDQRAGAEQDLRHALQIAPDHVAAMSDLSVLLAARGEVSEAKRLLERLLELRPDDEAIRQRLLELQ